MPVYVILPGQCFEQEIEVPSKNTKTMNQVMERPATPQMIRPAPLFLPPEEAEVENIETDEVKPSKKKKIKKKKSVTIQEDQIEVPPAETQISKTKKKKERKSVKESEIIETPVKEICIKPEILGDGKATEDGMNVIPETRFIQDKEIASPCEEKKMDTEIDSSHEDKKLYSEPIRPRTRYGWPDRRSDRNAETSMSATKERSRDFVSEETARKPENIEVSCEKKSGTPLIQKIQAEVKQFEEKEKVSITTRQSLEEIKVSNGNHREIVLDMAEEDEKDAMARARVSPEITKSEVIRKGLRRVSPPPEMEITVPPEMLEPSHVKFIEDGKQVTLETVLEDSKKKSSKKKFRVPKRLKGLFQKVSRK